MKVYTIDGIDDEEFPWFHPDVLKYNTYKEAKAVLDGLRGSEETIGCYVAEHELEN